MRSLLLKLLIAFQLLVLAGVLGGVRWWVVGLRDSKFRASRMLVSSGIIYISLGIMVGLGLIFTVTRLYDPDAAADIGLYVRFAVTAVTILPIAALWWWRRGL